MVCSDPFRESNYQETVNITEDGSTSLIRRKRPRSLKPEAVPSIFPFRRTIVDRPSLLMQLAERFQRHKATKLARLAEVFCPPTDIEFLRKRVTEQEAVLAETWSALKQTKAEQKKLGGQLLRFSNKYGCDDEKKLADILHWINGGILGCSLERSSALEKEYPE